MYALIYTMHDCPIILAFPFMEKCLPKKRETILSTDDVVFGLDLWVHVVANQKIRASPPALSK
jgi:hypothetical protein